MLKDYDRFRKNNVRIIVVSAVDDEDALAAYWQEHSLPFEYRADPGAVCARAFGQRFDIFKKGMIPAQFILDETGTIIYVHYGWHMADIPGNKKMLKIIGTQRAEK